MSIRVFESVRFSPSRDCTSSQLQLTAPEHQHLIECRPYNFRFSLIFFASSITPSYVQNCSATILASNRIKNRLGACRTCRWTTVPLLMSSIDDLGVVIWTKQYRKRITRNIRRNSILWSTLNQLYMSTYILTVGGSAHMTCVTNLHILCNSAKVFYGDLISIEIAEKHNYSDNFFEDAYENIVNNYTFPIFVSYRKSCFQKYC